MIAQNVGSSTLRVSRIALGCMQMSGTWNPQEVGLENVKKAIAAFESALQSGITLFDHADFYGATTCESIFKDCLKAVPGAREQIVIATKCGVRSGFYDLSQKHIEYSIYKSLDRLGIQYVDLYQMHRPDPLTHPEETAAALKKLVADGVVRHVGVSNYCPEQFRALQAYMGDIPLVSNQISISLMRLAPIYESWEGGDGILDQCMAQNVTPLAYSALAKNLLTSTDGVSGDGSKEKILQAVRTELKVQSIKYGATPGQIALAWLLAHPAGIVPVVGSNNPQHISEASQAVDISLEREDWYKLWTAAWGRGVP